MIMGFKFQLLPRTEGFNFIMLLCAFMTIECTKARRMWRIKLHTVQWGQQLRMNIKWLIFILFLVHGNGMYFPECIIFLTVDMTNRAYVLICCPNLVFIKW
jgi:hypothetical protein